MESNKEEQITTVSEENIYKLNGRVPLRKAIPFGLQHVLAMFVANLAPIARDIINAYFSSASADTTISGENTLIQ